MYFFITPYHIMVDDIHDVDSDDGSMLSVINKLNLL